MVSGNVFDPSGSSGNPGVAQGSAVASISAYQLQDMEHAFVVYAERPEVKGHIRETRVLGDLSHQRSPGRVRV